MRPYHQPPIVRLQIPGPGGEPPRTRRQEPHPPSTVAAVRHLVETTRLPHRVIAERTRVDKGTISRWIERHGWTRPPGAWPSTRRAGRRHVPVVIGRVLATRLRAQAERLVAEIERAPRVDPVALAEAVALLERARAEQRVRRGKRLMPPPAPPPEPRAKPDLDPVTRAHIRETRRQGAHKAWATRRARQDQPPAHLRPGALEAAAIRRARCERRLGRDLPSPHLPHVTKPPRIPATWDRRAAALKGWKRRYAHMREAGWTPKTGR